MPGTVIGQSLNLGYAGKISRNPNNKVNSRFVKSILDGNGAETLSAIPFGFAVVTNTDNTYSKFGQTGSGVTAAAAAAVVPANRQSAAPASSRPVAGR